VSDGAKSDAAMHQIWSEWFSFYERHFRAHGLGISAADQMAFYEIAQPILRSLSSPAPEPIAEPVAWRADHEVNGEYTRRYTTSEWEAYQWNEQGLNVQGLALIDPFSDDRQIELANMDAYIRQRDDAMADLNLAYAEIETLRQVIENRSAQRLDDFEEGHAKGYSDAATDALATPPDPKPEAVSDAAAFLIDRLDDFERDPLQEDDCEYIMRQFAGHVSPAIERLRAALSTEEDGK
jgi:hypothetical protein